MFSSNAAQLKGKLDSFKSELKETNAAIFTLQEVHFENKGKFKINNFEIFEAIRKKAKDGTANIKRFLIQEYSDDFELLAVEVKAANKVIHIMSGYEPQENWPTAT